MIKFEVDEKNGIIKAIIQDCEMDAMNEALKALCGSRKYDFSIMNNSFIGKAKCHPQDIFDIEKGKIIAKERMLNKYNNSKNKSIIKFHKRLKDEIKCLEEYMKKKNIDF